MKSSINGGFDASFLAEVLRYRPFEHIRPNEGRSRTLRHALCHIESAAIRVFLEYPRIILRLAWEFGDFLLEVSAEQVVQNGLANDRGLSQH